MPSETATTAAAEVAATRSAQEESAYPPPSCSAFHGRSGSSECMVTRWGTPYSRDARCPARLAYQVCECSTSAPATLSAIDRSIEKIRSTWSVSAAHGWCATTPEPSLSGPPWQCTVTSTSPASARDRYSTCTPAPPYTFGGYSRVSSATLSVTTEPPAPCRPR
jgi:hypothetical protein